MKHKHEKHVSQYNSMIKGYSYLFALSQLFLCAVQINSVLTTKACNCHNISCIQFLGT